MNQDRKFQIENGWLQKYLGKESDVVIPGGVIGISMWAFSGCKTLKSVVIPETVTMIGARAFYDCTALLSVSLPLRHSRIVYQ